MAGFGAFSTGGVGAAGAGVIGADGAIVAAGAITPQPPDGQPEVMLPHAEPHGAGAAMQPDAHAGAAVQLEQVVVVVVALQVFVALQQ